MQTSFLPVGAEAIADVLRLMREFYAQQAMAYEEPTARAALEGLAADPRWGCAWRIASGGETAGYLVLTVGYSLEFGGRFGLLDEFFVVSAHRGRGIGRRALDFLAGECRARGLRALRLEVGTENTRAIELYKRSAFQAQQRYLMTRWIEPARLSS